MLAEEGRSIAAIMKPADLIRRARKRKGWSQRRLAAAISVTPGFVNQLESGESLPSYERCVSLSAVLDISVDALLEATENARVHSAERHIRTRGAAIRKAVKTREAVRGSSRPSRGHAAIADEIAADADLFAAYRHLKRALSDPALRVTVLHTLQAFARAAAKSQTVGPLASKKG